MGGETLATTVAVWCAGALAVECSAVVALARDQHSAARHVRWGLGICAVALALVTLGFLVRLPPIARRLAVMVIPALAQSGVLLVAGWAMAALTIIEVARGVALLAGRTQPMRLRATRDLAWPFVSFRGQAHWLLGAPVWRFCALAAATAAVVFTDHFAVANREPIAAGSASRIVVLAVIVAAIFAGALWRTFPRRAAGLLSFATLLACLQVAYVLLGVRV